MHSIKKSTIYLYGIVLLICFSRGVFELLASKLTGYVMQFGALCIMAVALFNPVIRQLGNDRSFAGLSRTIFMVISGLLALSLGFTIIDGSNTPLQALIVLIPNFINLYFLLSAVCIATSRNELILTGEFDRAFTKIVVLISVYVSVLSILQYIGLIDFPGDAIFGELSRLSGPLGSKQHLSLVVSILSIVLLSIILRKPTIATLGAFFLSIFILVVCYTRIGYLVFFITSAIWVALYSKKFASNAFSLKGMSIITIILLAFIGVFFNFEKEIEGFILRLNTFDIEDGSNVARTMQWGEGLAFYVNDTIWLISNKMGSASQIPRQLLNLESSHYESGQIQYLVNFGLISLLLINSLFMIWFLKTKKSGINMGLPLAMMVALVIYMFNEIVPVFLMFPLIAIEQRLTNNKSLLKH
jgi:hypothetical protein